jgi:hypothetical protein
MRLAIGVQKARKLPRFQVPTPHSPPSPLPHSGTIEDLEKRKEKP